MQRKFQHTFTKSKMNQDLDARLLQPDEYREGTNIAVSRAESDDVGALENILGNEIISNLEIANVFLEQVIGWKINENTNKIYLFVTDYQDNSLDQISNFTPIGSTNKIVLVDTIANITSTIVEGRFLNFSWNSPVLDAIFLEDLMFFTDNRNQPRKINITKPLGYYTDESQVSVAKYSPYQAISLVKKTTATVLAAPAPTSTTFVVKKNLAILPGMSISSTNANDQTKIQGGEYITVLSAVTSGAAPNEITTVTLSSTSN